MQDFFLKKKRLSPSLQITPRCKRIPSLKSNQTYKNHLGISTKKMTPKETGLAIIEFSLSGINEKVWIDILP